MRLLELFAGTGSVGKVAKSLGWDVTSLDLDFRTKPDIVADILHWNFTNYAPGLFDVIWASPPCTEYSVAKTVGARDLDKADQIVKHTLEIIEYLRPKYFIIENPQTGMLKDRPFAEPTLQGHRLLQVWDAIPQTHEVMEQRLLLGPSTAVQPRLPRVRRQEAQGDSAESAQERGHRNEAHASDLIDEILQSIRNETFSSIIV